MIDRQQVLVEQVGAVLGVLEAQGRLDAALELHHAERLGQVVVGPGQQHLGHRVGVVAAGDHDDLQVRHGGFSRSRRHTSVPCMSGMSMSSRTRS